MVRGIESFREWFRGYEEQYAMPAAVREDMQTFFERMEAEEVDPKQLGIRGKTKESILDQLRGIYR